MGKRRLGRSLALALLSALLDERLPTTGWGGIDPATKFKAFRSQAGLALKTENFYASLPPSFPRHLLRAIAPRTGPARGGDQERPSQRGVRTKSFSELRAKYSS